MRHLASVVIAAFVVLAVPAAAQQSPEAQEPPDFWHRDTLTGDWGGLRTVLADHGIAVTASYTAELWANVQGGLKQGSAYDGLFLPQVDVDLDKLLGWQGASFRVSMIQGHGPALSPGWVGNLMNVSNLVVIPPATRLYNLWLQQNLFDDKLSLRLGMMNVDAEFVVSQTASVFMNGTFGWPEWAAADLPGGGPAYPLSAPGVRVKLQPEKEGFYAMAAVFSGDPTGHGGSNNPATPLPTGTVISFTGGAFFIAETGYAVNQDKDAKGPPLALKLGTWYHNSDRFQDQRFDVLGISLASPASAGIPREHAGNWGIYGIADVTLYQAEGSSLSAFVRMAGSPGDRNLVQLYMDAGLAYKGLIPSRSDDTAGIAIGYTRIGANARGLDHDTQFFGNPLFPIRSQEVVLELTYQAQLTPWLLLQPDLQRIFNPGGHVPNPDGSIRRDALVLGLRSTITF
ncbi:MAG TPA: carbohydrate porin [Acetobacteraceae bacterium]|nr:carbohydrate porin [Acetobacteraceae bacterium]